jgi:hypothetical protein
MLLIPALPLPPPPTTNKRTDVTPAGTVQSQLPTVEKVKTVSPPTVVDVGLHAAAFAVKGIETNKPESKVVTTIDAIFGRAEPTFMRANPKITFTSLLE